MAELAENVLDRVETLARRVRGAVDPAEADAYHEEIDELLSVTEFSWRIREEDDRDVLVVHPAEWVEDGTIRVDRIDDLDRAVEIPLDGAGDDADWDAVEAHNREIVRAVRAEHGDVHGDNADAFADFMGNHCARRIETATATDLEEFRTEYFPRNAWPTADQKEVLERSLELVFATAGEPMPGR